MTIGLFYGVMMMCQYQQLPGNKQRLGGKWSHDPL